MLVLYVIVNFRLLWKLMGGGTVFHKAEYVLSGCPSAHLSKDYAWAGSTVRTCTSGFWLCRRCGRAEQE